MILNQDLDGSERPDHHVFFFFGRRVCLYLERNARASAFHHSLTSLLLLLLLLLESQINPTEYFLVDFICCCIHSGFIFGFIFDGFLLLLVFLLLKHLTYQ